MSNIQILKGYDITEEHINKLKVIAKSRYSEEIYNEYFSNIKNVKDLTILHFGINTYLSIEEYIKEEILVLSDTWFMCYKIDDYYIDILEWVSSRTKNIKQSIEMMTILKEILLTNKDKLIIGLLRHDTSYALYTKLKNRKYFKEYSNDAIIDCAAPEYLKREIDSLNYDTINDFINSNDFEDYESYSNYILHDISFGINKSFVKKYNK